MSSVIIVVGKLGSLTGIIKQRIAYATTKKIIIPLYTVYIKDLDQVIPPHWSAKMKVLLRCNVVRLLRCVKFRCLG